MGWFKRIKEGITTSTHEKTEMPDGLWNKCPRCKHIITSKVTNMNQLFYEKQTLLTLKKHNFKTF